jgi:very-short-patch-repair endonuclease
VGCDVFRAGCVRSAKTAALEGLCAVVGLTLGRVADDPGANAHTPNPDEQRGAERQHDAAKRTHRVQVLGVRAQTTVSGSVEERIAHIARLQRGRVARRQLSAVGIGPGTVSWLVSQHLLIRRLRGVFAFGHTAPVELDRETEALLAVRDGAALSHFSAAALWGLCGAGPAVEVVIRHGRSSRMPGIRVHRSRVLESRDVRIRKGLPVTSPARTLLDIAVSAADRQLEIAFDRAIVERILRHAHVRDVLDRAGGHRGRARLAALLEYELGGTTVTQSDREEWMLALIRAAGLPAPHVNAPFETWRIDFYWPEARFAVEVDSHRFHSSRYRFERDRRKDNALRRAHIEVMRIIDREIKERSHALVADVARELAKRGL